ncbi:MAG: GNAT family N-acetyltransferase [Colwellia sp.]
MKPHNDLSNNYFLEGKSIYLRNVGLQDVNDNYYNWLNDPEVNQFLETRFVVQSKEKIAEFVKCKEDSNSEILLAICDKDNHLHIGNIKIGPINWYHRRADISLFIGDKNYWGKGVATQAIQLVSQFSFQVLNLNKLMAGAYKNNKGSIKAFQRCGYQIEGNVEDYALVNNKGVSLIQLGITAKQFALIVQEKSL